MLKFARRAAFVGAVSTTGLCVYKPEHAKQIFKQIKEHKSVKPFLEKCVPGQSLLMPLIPFNTGILSFDTVLQTIKMQNSDHDRNKILRLYMSHISFVEPGDVKKLMNMYFSDSNRLEALGIIENRLTDMDVDAAKAILNTAHSDSTKLEMLKMLRAGIMIYSDTNLNVILNTFWAPSNKTQALEILLQNNPSIITVPFYQIPYGTTFEDVVLGTLSLLTLGYLFSSENKDDSYVMINNKRYNKNDFVDGVKYTFTEDEQVTEITRNGNTFSVNTLSNGSSHISVGSISTSGNNSSVRINQSSSNTIITDDGSTIKVNIK